MSEENKVESVDPSKFMAVPVEKGDPGIKEKPEEKKPLTRADWLPGFNQNPDGEYKPEDAEEVEEKKPVYRLLSSIRPAPIGSSSLMCSRGIAHIKRVTVNEKNEEVVEILEIPITTARIDVTRKNLADAKKPTPPMKDRLIAPNSEIGKAMGYSVPTVCSIAQIDDRNFAKAMEAYNTKLSWSLVAEAIDIELFFFPSTAQPDDEPTLAKTTSEKVTSLKQSGYTEAQILEIAANVGRIQLWSEEERRRFFGEI